MFKRVFTTFLVIGLLLISYVPTQAKTFETEVIRDSIKPWEITFNNKINYTNISDLPIYIMTNSGEKHPISLKVSDDFTKIIVKPTKSYSIGTTYTLTISKEMKSEGGKNLKENVTKQFTLQGSSILDIQANLNPFVTDITVQSNPNVASIKVFINNFEIGEMKKIGSNKFGHGLRGLADGDTLTFKAYDKDGSLLETQSYEIK